MAEGEAEREGGREGEGCKKLLFLDSLGGMNRWMDEGERKGRREREGGMSLVERGSER